MWRVVGEQPSVGDRRRERQVVVVVVVHAVSYVPTTNGSSKIETWFAIVTKPRFFGRLHTHTHQQDPTVRQQPCMHGTPQLILLLATDL